MATDIQAGHSSRLPQMTIIGAMASSGTVCEATTYGISPRSSSVERPNNAPSANPTRLPARKPAAASRQVNQAERSKIARRIVSFPRWAGRNSAPRILAMCGMDLSSDRMGRLISA